ncbi:MAG TPA: CpsD/CapB family tyrosine-protein kinase [Candidatus Omnitrophota bacterium]|nr:CpsD/CapB family tyrosine-protein kinase [Candidatus Omnitrophota bacterium]
MGKITDALKKVSDERVQRIQKKPETQYVVRKVTGTKIEPHIVSFHDPSSPIGEQYKIIRTNLQSLRSTRNLKTFIITSSVSGEGKTVTSVNLAIAMAHDVNSKKVLLIDADMRKGKVAKYFGLAQTPGLSEILKGEVEADQTFISPDIENLTVIPAGRIPRNPAELLGSKKMASFLESLKTRFDYIFIDTPPVMPVTDSCVLGAMADGVIMVIQAGRTQRDIVKHAERRLTQAHANLLGYVMTNIEYHLPQYLYRYVHKYSDDAYSSKPAAIGV